jgi:uncharacterized protein VirK/YbjX
MAMNFLARMSGLFVSRLRLVDRGTRVSAIQSHFAATGLHKRARRNSILFLGLKALGESEHLKGLLQISVIWRRALRYGRILGNLRELRAVMTLLTDEMLSELPKVQAAFPFKFLHERLFCRGLSTRDRVQCLLQHYNFLRSALTPSALQQILFSETCVLFQIIKNDHTASITLCLPSHNIEGELSLLFKVGDEHIYSLSFTIVPGYVVRSTAERAILISRVQGVKAKSVQFRIATTALIGVAPPMALLEAVQGIGRAFNISHLYGVSAERHPTFTRKYAELFSRAYDEFYAANGMTPENGGFFHGTIPLMQKPISSARSSSRRRIKLRRGMRKSISDAVYESMARNCLG